MYNEFKVWMSPRKGEPKSSVRRPELDDSVKAFGRRFANCTEYHDFLHDRFGPQVGVTVNWPSSGWHTISES